jgi:hypothetical protein
MTRRIKPTILIAIAAAVLLFATVYALPDSVKAVELLVITNTPTPTPDTPTPTNTPTDPTVEPPTDTPTPSATSTPTSVSTTPDTPTPTDPAKPPAPKEPKETEVVLLPATGEFLRRHWNSSFPGGQGIENTRVIALLRRCGT